MSVDTVSTSERFRDMWDAWEGIEGGAVEAVIEERAPRGSLRPERRRIRAAGVAGEVLCVNNIEAVFSEEDAGVQQRLALLEKLAEQHPRYRVETATLDKIKGFTDRILEEIGFPEGEISPVPVVEFTVSNPDLPRRELTIYSIAAGVGGYNTLTDLRPQDDNSRRWWFMHTDGNFYPGVDPRTVPSNGTIGTVYEHGAYEPHREVIAWYAPISDTSVLEGLITDFYDNNPNGTVAVNLHKELGGKKGVDFGPIPLQPNVDHSLSNLLS